MYDSTDASAVPGNALCYAGYVNGRWPTHGPLQARFPRARVFGIDVLGTAWEQASILDFELGDVHSPRGLLAWATEREKFRPHTATIYCDRSGLRIVEHVLADTWHQV